MKDISDFISQVGFPIVVCLLMIWQNEKTSDQFINIVSELKELVEDNTKAINLLLEADHKQGNLIQKVDDVVKKSVDQNGSDNNADK